MKIIAATLAAFMAIAPAYADKDDDAKQLTPNEIIGNTPAEFAYLMQCTATELALIHLRVQAAASLAALSAPKMTPQISMLGESYTNLIREGQKQVELYMEVIKSSVLPQVKGKASQEVLMTRANELMHDSLASLSELLANPENSLDDQTKMEQLLIIQSRNCESLANKIKEHHTL